MASIIDTIYGKMAAKIAPLSNEQILDMLGQLDYRNNIDHRYTWMMLRGALIDRDICPDCRTALDDEANCTGCPRPDEPPG